MRSALRPGILRGLAVCGHVGQPGAQPFADFGRVQARRRRWARMITTPVAVTPAKAATPSALRQRICLGWTVPEASITLDEARLILSVSAYAGRQ